MSNKKLSKTKKKIIILSFIYLLILVSFLSPFIAIEGSNKTLGFIIAGLLTLAYLFILLVFLWDWIKSKTGN